MKKNIFAALAFAAVAGGAAATDAPATVRVSLELMKNDKPVWSAATSTLQGQRTPIVETQEHPYVGSCDPDSAGVLRVRPATFVTGIEAYVTPLRVDAEGAIVSVAFSQKELTGMKSATSGGCTIDLPSFHTRQTATQIEVKQGEKIELPVAPPAPNESDKYVLVVRML
jgi:hypothetical protein